MTWPKIRYPIYDTVGLNIIYEGLMLMGLIDNDEKVASSTDKT